MKEFIKKLQKKPEHKRKQILYLSTAVLGGIVLIFWAYTLGHRFSKVSASSFQNDLKPFGIIKDDVVGSLKEAQGGR